MSRRIRLAALAAALVVALATPWPAAGARDRRHVPAAGPAVALPRRRGRGGGRLLRGHDTHRTHGKHGTVVPDAAGACRPRRRRAARSSARSGLAWWYGAIAVGFVVGDISPLPAVLLWIGIWVGLPIVAVIAGNPWPSLSPFRTTFAALEWLARRAGVDRLDLGLPYPRGAGTMAGRRFCSPAASGRS